MKRVDKARLDWYFRHSVSPYVERHCGNYRVYTAYHVDSFTREMFRGNPAGVVPNATGLSVSEMQNIARELRHSETAFVFPSHSDGYDVEVRFFTPTVEVPICGHATIAAHYVLAREMNLENCRIVQRTTAGDLPVDVVKIEDDYGIVMTQGKIEFGEFIIGEVRGRLLKALGLKTDDLDERLPIQVASTGHSKVMIGIKSRDMLNSLRPNFGSLVEISREIGCNGYFVFTFDSGDESILTSGRMFAPAIGIGEDPVTGNANGPLGAYLVNCNLIFNNNGYFEFKSMQGEAIGRTGFVHVSVEVREGKPVEVKVGGEATVFFKSEFRLPNHCE